MRVLIAHNRYRLTGGEERHVELLEQGLREAGIEVRRFERDSDRVARSRTRRVLTGLGLAYRPGGGGIGPAIDEWEPDVVHFHNIWPLLTPSALRIAKRRNAAVLLTAHNYRFVCPGGMLLQNGSVHQDCIEGSSLVCALRNPRDSFAESLAYGVALEVQRRLRMLERWVDAFIAPSTFMAQVLVRAGLPEKRVHVIANGLPCSEEPRRDGRAALFFGRLSAEKGVRTLLEAARLAREIPVVIAGAGPLEPEVRAAPVTYLGRLDQQGLSGALDGAAFSLVPSECYDNQPFAVLEAFAAGRPVIATRIGGLPEIVRDEVTGLLVSPHSPAELAGAMRRLWFDPNLTRELGRNAFHEAREKFSLATHVSKVIALYEDTRASLGNRRHA
jgi:glycosyltransferase involved in cell wall biosynthesis